MFQAEKRAFAKGLWLESVWHVGGNAEMLLWLRKIECGNDWRRENKDRQEPEHAGPSRPIPSLCH